MRNNLASIFYVHIDTENAVIHGIFRAAIPLTVDSARALGIVGLDGINF